MRLLSVYLESEDRCRENIGTGRLGRGGGWEGRERERKSKRGRAFPAYKVKVIHPPCRTMIKKEMRISSCGSVG